MLRRLFGAVTGSAIAGLAFLSSLSSPAMAGLGQPTSGELGLQLPATSLMSELSSLHNTVNVIIIAIAVFVLLLLLYVIFRFNEKSNPTPSRTTHNTALEVAWTIVPILILVAIAIPPSSCSMSSIASPSPTSRSRLSLMRGSGITSISIRASRCPPICCMTRTC